jgi:hypothetical protein
LSSRSHQKQKIVSSIKEEIEDWDNDNLAELLVSEQVMETPLQANAMEIYGLIRQSMAQSATSGKRPRAPTTLTSATSASSSALLGPVASLATSNNEQALCKKIQQYDTRMKDIKDRISVLEEQCKPAKPQWAAA